MFEKIQTNSLKMKVANVKTEKDDEYDLPVLTAGIINQGLVGFVPRKNATILKNVISVSANGANTGAMFYQPYDFTVLQDSYAIKFSKQEIQEDMYLFFISCLQKVVRGNFDWSDKAGWNKIQNLKISLPLTSQNEIDFSYMENYIQQIQNERFSEVKQFIKENNYENCELTEAEKKAILDFENGNIKFAEFKIGDLFEKLKMGMKKKTFNKSEDVSDNRSEVYSLPLVNAKHGNNGIMYYGKESDFDSVEMSIDIVGDGAIATGDVYPQPQKTGVLYNAYLIKFKKTEVKMNSEILFYLACSLQKSIKLKFGYDNKASWEKVKEEYFNLPLTPQNTIDYAFMENYILAQKKCVMKNVVEFVG